MKFLFIRINEIDFIETIWIPLFIIPITKIADIIYCVCWLLHFMDWFSFTDLLNKSTEYSWVH